MKTGIVALIATIAVVAGFGGGYFFRDWRLQKQRASFAGGNFQRFAGQRGSLSNGGGMRGAVVGEILSMDDKSATVKLPDGSTKIVLFSGSTTYSNSSTAARTDLKMGETIAVFGPPNPDGSVTAVNIQINPMFLRLTPTPTPK